MVNRIDPLRRNRSVDDDVCMKRAHWQLKLISCISRVLSDAHYKYQLHYLRQNSRADIVCNFTQNLLQEPLYIFQ